MALASRNSVYRRLRAAPWHCTPGTTPLAPRNAWATCRREAAGTTILSLKASEEVTKGNESSCLLQLTSMTAEYRPSTSSPPRRIERRSVLLDRQVTGQPSVSLA
eukprot:scaffold28279_cov31-Tisochrysis_lutea.AAC.2